MFLRYCRHLRSIILHGSRPLATSSPTYPQSSSASSPTSLLTEALKTLSTLPDLTTALSTHDASTARVHYQRLISILSRQPDPYLTLAAREHHASFCHRVGDVEGEWRERKAVAEGIGGGRAWNALALCGMRGGKVFADRAMWAGGVAGKTGGGWGLLGMLHGAVLNEESRAVLDGLVKMAEGVVVDGVDVGAWAKVFGGLRVRGREGSMMLRGVAERWERKGGFEVVDVLCAAAQLMDEVGALKDVEEILDKALQLAKGIGNDVDTAEPLIGLAGLYAKKGEAVMAEGLYRAVEDKFRAIQAKKAFTVSAADVFCRAMDAYANLLARMEFNGKKRESEMQKIIENVSEVRTLFPQVFKGRPLVPLWYIDAVMPKLACVPP